MVKLSKLISQLIPLLAFYPRWAQGIFVITFVTVLVSACLFVVLYSSASKQQEHSKKEAEQLGKVSHQEGASKFPGFVRKSGNFNGVIVFVHGVIGKAFSTWTNKDSGVFWPDLLTQDATFDSFDVYVYEYPSPFLRTSFNQDEVAEDMRLRFDIDGITKYSEIVFLTHSMGGIVTRAYLLKYQDIAKSKVKFMHFFATPTEGSELSRLGNFLSKNPQFGRMVPITSDSYLADQLRSWHAAQFQIETFCAYEKEPLGPVGIIVNMQSAAALCTGHIDPIYANHIDIVKPRDLTSKSHLVFKSAFAKTHPVKKAKADSARTEVAPDGHAVDSKFDFESGVMGWRAHDYNDTRGCTSVKVTADRSYIGKQSLEIILSISGMNPQRQKGEARVKLFKINASGKEIPLNLEGRTVSAWLYAPQGSYGPSESPNGVQLLLKDANAEFIYSPWRSVSEDEWIELLLPVGTITELKSQGKLFDPTQVKILGVKFAVDADKNSSVTYEGSIWLDHVNW